MGNNIVKRVMMKCLPKDVVKPLALHLDTADTFQQIRKLVMRQMHDEMTGMLEGDHTQPLYHVKPDTNNEQTDEESSLQPDLDTAESNWAKAEQEYWAAALAQKGKGGKGAKGKGSKLKGKGYGECWNCGQQGHPARECPVAGKLHGGVGSKDEAKGANTAAAFKGKGESNWKGKGWKGKGKGGSKRSLNPASESEYIAARGNGGQEEGEYQGYYDYNSGYEYSIMNQWTQVPSNQHYSMMVTKSKPTITSGPKYFPAAMLEDEDEDSDDEDTGPLAGNQPNSNCNCTGDDKHNQAAHNIKKKAGEVNKQNKNAVRFADIEHIGEGNHEPQEQSQPQPRQPTRPRLPSQQ